MDFYDSFYYLYYHPIFDGLFQSCLDVAVVKVDPHSHQIEVPKERNTKTEIWLECGPVEYNKIHSAIFTHDIRLDTGGDTFEDAIINLANLVQKYYPATDDKPKH